MASGIYASAQFAASGPVVLAGTIDGKPTEVSFLGFSIRENAGVAAAATVRIRQTDAAGPILAEIELAANGAQTEWFGPQGIKCRGHINIEVVAGVVEGVVYYG